MSDRDLYTLNEHFANFAVALLATLLAKDQKPGETHVKEAIQLLKLAESNLEPKEIQQTHIEV